MVLTGSQPPIALIARTSGKLSEIKIINKQYVQTGEYLSIIENPANTSDIQFLKKYIKQLNLQSDTIIYLPPKELKLGQVQTSYSNFYTVLFDYIEFIRLQYYIKKIAFMKLRLNQYNEYYLNAKIQKKIVSDQFQIAKIQYYRDSIMHNEGFTSSKEIESSKNQYLQGWLTLESMNSTVKNIEMQITQIQETLLDTEYQYQDKKNSLKTQLRNQMSQLINEIQAWEMNYVLITPINGQVSSSNYWVANQNVVAGETVFTIVPTEKGKMMGKAEMPMTRSGKVKSGQKVNIKFANFPDNEYGIVKGFVKNISAVPIKNSQGSDYYIVEIELPEGLKTTYNKNLPFLPEMQADADIITDDISLFERFIMPIRKILKVGFE